LTEKIYDKIHANSRRWHFLLVGEHGQIKSVKKFRGLVIIAVAVVTIAVAGIAGLGFLYLRGVTHNMRLNHRIAALQQQVAAIQAEKEILMARLVIAETKLKGDQPTTDTLPDEPKAPSTPAKETAQAAPATDSKQSAPLTPSVDRAVASVANETPSAVTEQANAIAIEDFQATLDTYQNVLTLQYKVRNTRTDGVPVAGHTVLILRNSEQDIDTWVALPKVKLVDGRPTGATGQPFRISRFRVAKFTIEGYADPSQFDSATVYVYAKTGELILEKEFSVQIKVT
jgi:hypothetical protein